ncbi:MAG: hypothetical protein OMM_06697 [Candidatus Magnetoglobus multicellularis str. Araruama]|uniref:Uncharacterized protein n=1 Tax=Candidatus Magnetoglobus multicellularis str. Araruama TaxID=890399 RepID=A0A1V1PGC0_9BACT|nr:MAG: hypothetical protein OMM_06697 [Candidatus Magnetoglobus multicellularis str. Araruama]
MTISYANPQKYIKDMYELGAITFLYHKKKQTYYQVDLFKHTLIKKNPAHLQGYSRFIRVITDFCWDIQKQQYASQLHTSYDHLKLYLIIPEKLENLWLGHQLKLFQKYGIEQKDIINVTARFANKKLKLTSVNMAAGTKIIKDISGI